uniref:Anoctamin n=1 Tax=Heterorhabditis bacteriophora TaxID=37862 RepID=A0A1I7WM30_HETBA
MTVNFSAKLRSSHLSLLFIYKLLLFTITARLRGSSSAQHLTCKGCFSTGAALGRRHRLFPGYVVLGTGINARPYITWISEMDDFTVDDVSVWCCHFFSGCRMIEVNHIIFSGVVERCLIFYQGNILNLRVIFLVLIEFSENLIHSTLNYYFKIESLSQKWQLEKRNTKINLCEREEWPDKEWQSRIDAFIFSISIWGSKLIWFSRLIQFLAPLAAVLPVVLNPLYSFTYHIYREEHTLRLETNPSATTVRATTFYLVKLS